MNVDYIKYAVDNVTERKMRSSLTILSITIGIAAIFALVSFGLGLSNYIDNLGEEMGTDKLMMTAKGVGAPGTDQTFSIPKEDIEYLRKVKGIDKMAGIYFQPVEIEENKQKKYAYGMSIPQDENKDIIMSMMTVDIVYGRDLKSGDKLKAVFGYNYMLENKIFEKSFKLNDKVSINGVTVEVIGFMDTIGNPQDDSNVYLTEEGFLEIFPNTLNQFQMGIAQIDMGENPEYIAERATEKLIKHKDIEEGKELFFIQSYGQLIETFNTVLDVIKGVLILIALISLLVAGVNITNTMYTAVLERTKEIGVMKAIGARNGDIASIFLIEAGILGSTGGILGIILGYGIAKAGGFAAAQAGYSLLYPIFPWYLLLGCYMFALIVGMLAGLLPSKQAAKLRPVDALRYE